MGKDNTRHRHPFMPQMAGCGKGGRQKKAQRSSLRLACLHDPDSRNHFCSALRTFLSSAVLNTTVILPRVGLP